MCINDPITTSKERGKTREQAGRGKKRVIQHSPGVMKIDFIAVSETFGFYLVP